AATKTTRVPSRSQDARRSDDDVDDAVDDRDHIARLTTGQQRDDARLLEREAAQLVLWRTGVNLDLSTALAVHGDGDGDALRPGELRVVGGPGATIVHRSIVPGALPELLGDERRERGQQLEQRLRIDAPPGAAGRLLVDVARELHEERDRRVV